MTDLKNIAISSENQDEWTKAIAKAIQLSSIYYGLFLVVVGCVCNPLSFIVMSRKSFRSSNLSLHLRVLSASDLANLLNMFFNILMLRAFGVDFSPNRISCQASLFTGYFTLYLSSWILVIVTSERAVTINRRHRVHILCSRVVGRVVLAITLVILSLLYLLPTITSEETLVVDTMAKTSTVLYCQAEIKDTSIYCAQYIIFILLFALSPSLLLVVLNIFIIAGVVKSRKNVMRKSASVSVDPRGNDTTNTTSVKRKRFPTSRLSRMSRREASLTKTVLAINITFISCNFPACIVGAALYYLGTDLGLIGLALNDLLLMFLYTNKAMNFFLYCVTGSKFRSELKAFFNDITQCCCTK